MRRTVVLICLLAAVAACTSAEPEPPTTTSSAAETSPTTPTVSAPATTLAPCRDAESDLSGYLAALDLGHLQLEPMQQGPLTEFLPHGEQFADELGMDCSGAFYADSSFGEMAQVIAAWDDEQTYAVIGGYAKAGSLERDEDGLIVDLDGVTTTRLTAAADDVLWGGVDDWSAIHTLAGIAAVAGPDPIGALGAWNRANARVTKRPILQMGGSSGWGSSTIDFTLYADGEMIAMVHAGGFPRTFEDTKASFQLNAEELVEIERMMLATGVAEGETFRLENQDIIDAGSLWFRFRNEDVTYVGGVYAPGWSEETPARQQVIDVAAHLDELVADLEPTVWIPESFAVSVVRHGPYSESNTMAWPGSFDLAAAAGRRCTLLEGEAAAAYLEDVALIGDEYRDRYKTIFAYGDTTYQVIAMALLPGDTDRQFDSLSRCNTGGIKQTEAVLGTWLWSTRGIDDYRMSLRAECSDCEDAVNLDGESSVAIAGWGEVRTVEDLFALAMGDGTEVVALTTDGYVGVPLRIEVRDIATGEHLRLLTTLFDCELGVLRISHDDAGESWMSIDGFDEWMLEGY